MRAIWQALFFVTLSLTTFACGPGAADPYFGRVAEPDPAHLTICSIGEPMSLDPAYALSTTEHKIVFELFDGLTSFDKNGLPVPSIAESVSIGLDVYIVSIRFD